MSFWSKKPETQQTNTVPDAVKEELSEIRNTYENIELRLVKLEKQEKCCSASEFVSSTNKRFEDISSQLVLQQENYTSSLSSNSKYMEESKKLIEMLQHTQNILEERIALYDEKLDKLKELTDKLDAALQSKSSTPSPYKQSPLTRTLVEQTTQNKGPSNVSVTGTTPVKTFSGQTKQQPSWIKKKIEEKPKEEELAPTINETIVRDA
jgi:hypothetical protein